MSLYHRAQIGQSPDDYAISPGTVSEEQEQVFEESPAGDEAAEEVYEEFSEESYDEGPQSYEGVQDEQYMPDEEGKVPPPGSSAAAPSAPAGSPGASGPAPGAPSSAAFTDPATGQNLDAEGNPVDAQGNPVDPATDSQDPCDPASSYYNEETCAAGEAPAMPSASELVCDNLINGVPSALSIKWENIGNLGTVGISTLIPPPGVKMSSFPRYGLVSKNIFTLDEATGLLTYVSFADVSGVAHAFLAANSTNQLPLDTGANEAIRQQCPGYQDLQDLLNAGYPINQPGFDPTTLPLFNMEYESMEEEEQPDSSMVGAAVKSRLRSVTPVSGKKPASRGVASKKRKNLRAAPGVVIPKNLKGYFRKRTSAEKKAKKAAIKSAAMSKSAAARKAQQARNQAFATSRVVNRFQPSIARLQQVSKYVAPRAPSQYQTSQAAAYRPYQPARPTAQQTARAATVTPVRQAQSLSTRTFSATRRR